MPNEVLLPPPSDEYLEIETAMKHGGWQVWTRHLGPQERAKLMAHELHKGMREHYYFDKRANGEKEAKPKGEAPWEAVKKRFGM